MVYPIFVLSKHIQPLFKIMFQLSIPSLYESELACILSVHPFETTNQILDLINHPIVSSLETSG